MSGLFIKTDKLKLEIDIDDLSMEEFVSRYDTEEKCIDKLYDILEVQGAECSRRFHGIIGKINDRRGRSFKCPLCGDANPILGFFFNTLSIVLPDWFLGYYVFTSGSSDIVSFRKGTGFNKRRSVTMLSFFEENKKSPGFCYNDKFCREGWFPTKEYRKIREDLMKNMPLVARPRKERVIKPSKRVERLIKERNKKQDSLRKILLRSINMTN